MDIDWHAVKEWGGWIIGAIGGVLGIGAMRERSETERIDARIMEKVNPPLMHEQLTRIEGKIDGTREEMARQGEKIDSLSDRVNGVALEVEKQKLVRWSGRERESPAHMPIRKS